MEALFRTAGLPGEDTRSTRKNEGIARCARMPLRGGVFLQAGRGGCVRNQGSGGMPACYSTTMMQFSPPYWFQQRVVQQGSSVQMPSTTNRYSYFPGAR
jgi:hypothetical protein